MTPSHSRIQLFSHMLFVHQSFVKQVSVLKGGRWSVETTTWKRGSPGKRSSAVRLQRGWISFLQLSVQLTCGCNQLDRLQMMVPGTGGKGSPQSPWNMDSIKRKPRAAHFIAAIRTLTERRGGFYTSSGSLSWGYMSLAHQINKYEGESGALQGCGQVFFL